MAFKVSLYELVDISIGTPEVGVVNFNSLHTFLHALLRHLKVEDILTEIKQEWQPPPTSESGKVPSAEDVTKLGDNRLANLEKKLKQLEHNLQGVEDQVRGVEDQVQGVQDSVHGMGKKVKGFQKQVSSMDRPSATELIEKTRSGSDTAVADMWRLMQLQKKVEANEEGLTQRNEWKKSCLSVSFVSDLVRLPVQKAELFLDYKQQYTLKEE
uniref:Uncharacterized protein n=1 Tax=Sphaerodactylus townsendi TaxID=933632 RepID=A0ACB8EJV2_9SAUR